MKPALVGLGRAAASTLPAYLRDIAGINGSRATDLAATAYARLLNGVFSPRSPAQRVFAALNALRPTSYQAANYAQTLTSQPATSQP